MTDPANTPNTDTTKLRVEACLAEYKVLTDEIRWRDYLQAGAALSATGLLAFMYYVALTHGIHLGGSAEFNLWRAFSDLITLTGSTLCSLIGLYICSQAHRVAQIKVHVDTLLTTYADDPIEHLPPKSADERESIYRPLPLLLRLPLSTPLPTVFALLAVLQILTFAITRFSTSDPYFNFQRLYGPIPSPWPFLAFALLTLCWFLFVLFRLLATSKGDSAP